MLELQVSTYPSGLPCVQVKRESGEAPHVSVDLTEWQFMAQPGDFYLLNTPRNKAWMRELYRLGKVIPLGRLMLGNDGGAYSQFHILQPGEQMSSVCRRIVGGCCCVSAYL